MGHGGMQYKENNKTFDNDTCSYTVYAEIFAVCNFRGQATDQDFCG